ncbi:MAG: hypothetical protein H6705_20535 [Myxococcales bacterium]|nr:hypothetical protein [Myxococcales bacterium]
MRRLFVLLLVALAGCTDSGDFADSCRSDDNCALGQVCRESPVDRGRKICMVACVQDDECAAGQRCSFGRCQPLLPGESDGGDEDAAPADAAITDAAVTDAGDDAALDQSFPPPDALVDGPLPDFEPPDFEPMPDLGALDAEPIDGGLPSIDRGVVGDGGI